jgi:chaperonin GroEL
MRVYHRPICFKEDARTKLFKGVQILSDAVTTTLGPKGRNVAVLRQWGTPIVVHDGVTVAREVDSDDVFEKIGIMLVKEAAQKTNDEAGDGTTTATLLAYEIVRQGLELIKTGYNPMVLRNEIYAALPKLLEKLKSISTPVKENKEIAQVAFISAADESIGNLVAGAVTKMGEDGLVTVDEGETMETIVEYTKGMEIKRGYFSPYLITNEQRMEAVIINPVIAIINKKLTLANEMVPILSEMAKVSKDIVIIADDISGDALATMIQNKLKGNINAVGISAPTMDREAELADIAVVVGGKVMSEKTGFDLNTLEQSLGHAKKFVAARDKSTIIDGAGTKEQIAERAKAIKAQMKHDHNKFEKEKYETRLARLTTGVAVIKVGAKTEIDMREKVERVKDAVGAAEAAREEGIIPGGGTAFIKLKAALKGTTAGEKLLLNVLDSPVRKLMQNAGESENKIKEVIDSIPDGPASLGYEINQGKIMDLKEKGVIDPTKVVRLALENAVGVGTSILTTDCLIGLVVKEQGGGKTYE